MTQTGSSNAIVNAMLGWLKGLARWVLRLFNLSAGYSPLKFLANNWLQLLVVLLIVGMAADLLIWLIRWRPHWVWFHKKRVIINDKNFFAGEDEVEEEDDWDLPAEYMRREREQRRRRNWQDDDFVVAGAARRRREKRALQLAAETPAEIADDVFTGGGFNVNAKQKFSDRYEDEVFSVSNLPKAAGASQREDGARGAKRPRKPTNGARTERPRGDRRPAPGEKSAPRRRGEARR